MVAAANQQQRKSLFAPYLPAASIPPLLQTGKLVIGTLRVNKRNRSDAYVATDVLDADVFSESRFSIEIYQTHSRLSSLILFYDDE